MLSKVVCFQIERIAQIVPIPAIIAGMVNDVLISRPKPRPVRLRQDVRKITRRAQFFGLARQERRLGLIANFGGNGHWKAPIVHFEWKNN